MLADVFALALCAATFDLSQRLIVYAVDADLPRVVTSTADALNHFT
jgi:hypothetical protein